MARKATDLLEVFRISREAAEAAAAAKPSRKKPRASRKGADPQGDPTPEKPRFEGLWLNRRQLLLVSSALMLLVALSFTLGLAKGRSGAGGQPTTLHRATPGQLAIRARLPGIDPATSRKVDPEAVLRELAREFRIQRANLRIRSEGADLVIEVGPFTSAEEARSYLRGSGLEMAHLHMEDPFRFARIVPCSWDD